MGQRETTPQNAPDDSVIIKSNELQSSKDYQVYHDERGHLVKIRGHLSPVISISYTDGPLIIEGNVGERTKIEAKGKLIVMGGIANHCDIRVLDDKNEGSSLVCQKGVGENNQLYANDIKVYSEVSFAIGPYSKLYADKRVEIAGNVANGVLITKQEPHSERPVITVDGDIGYGSVVYGFSIKVETDVFAAPLAARSSIIIGGKTVQEVVQRRDGKDKIYCCKLVAPYITRITQPSKRELPLDGTTQPPSPKKQALEKQTSPIKENDLEQPKSDNDPMEVESGDNPLSL